MTKRQHIIITLLSMAVMVLLLLLSRKIWARLDLTESRTYTLSPVSAKLHREIDEEVRITYYVSGKLTSIDPTPGEIADILREYASRSRGKIKVFVRDPSKGSYRQDAERYGLLPQQLSNMGQDEASITMVYSGIVIEYLNRYEVLPLVYSPETLEYDVTSRIRSLSSGKKRELGVISADPEKSWERFYGYLNQALVQSGYSVQIIRPGEEIPDTLPALFVLGGVEALEEYDLYRIDRYIQLGGRVLFAVESVAVDFMNTWEARLMTDKGLLAMISFYGATVGPSLAMDSSGLIFPYQDRYSGEVVALKYSYWFEALGNQDHAVSSGTVGPDLFWPSPLMFTLPESGEVKGEELLFSSDEAWLATRDFAVLPEMSGQFTAEQEATRGRKMLAAALEGKFPSWFEGAEKPRRGGLPGAGEFFDPAESIIPSNTEIPGPEAEELPDMPAEPREARIIVIGDSDLAGPLFQVSKNERNLDLLIQSADWLSSDDDIAEMRNRRSYAARLDRISDRTKRLGTVVFAQILNVFFLPLAVIIFGIVRALKRKPKKEHTDVV
ncbi:MAG: GldG family protein [Treponema sp.]|jgi:ABC-type uncharacterized transport system involved in gliding motility auxiliary subunit|nr:GldG family protein [Treponema sp.]